MLACPLACCPALPDAVPSPSVAAGCNQLTRLSQGILHLPCYLRQQKHHIQIEDYAAGRQARHKSADLSVQAQPCTTLLPHIGPRSSVAGSQYEEHMCA